MSYSQDIDPRFENPLVTDRPDATEASSTVGKGVFQIETGGFYESFEANNIQNELYTYNTMLIRYGLLDRIEFRVGWDFVEGITKVNNTKLDNVTSGFSPILLGVKVDIVEEKGLLPEIALLLHTNHPFFAGEDYKTTSTGTDFRFSLSHTLSERSSLGYNLGMSWDGDTTRASYLYTLAYGYSLSDKIGAYVEVYGYLPEGLSFNHYWDAGFTYLVNNNLQFDAYFGTSLTEGQDILLGLGASFRVLPSKQN
ncbi:transporter [Winogradskyella maritima]|uniref:Transporter n=1 Tax=Winogradskyella maritima TaxID=1517766 RepID=A0ABV8AEN7_9FLAO|nr:transporter [Winogradskyella maritima]